MNKKIVSIVIISALMITMGAFSLFADTVPNSGSNWYNRERYYLDDNILYEWIGVTWTTPYIVENYGEFSNRVGDKTLIAQDYIIKVTFMNYSSTDTVIYNNNHFFFDINNTVPTNLIGVLTYSGYAISDIDDSATIGVFPSSSYAMQTRIYPSYDYLGNNTVDDSINITLPPGLKFNFSYKLTMYSFIPEDTLASVGLNGCSVPITNINVSTGLNVNYRWVVNNSYSSNNPSYNVKSILDAYTGNVQGAQDLTNQAETNDQKVAAIHEQEQQWYSQNQSAIESTGLQNFEFTSNQTQGLESISNLFNNLWNSLGQWNTVYTFTLMISFSTFLLRHSPRTKRTRKEKSES